MSRAASRPTEARGISDPHDSTDRFQVAVAHRSDLGHACHFVRRRCGLERACRAVDRWLGNHNRCSGRFVGAIGSLPSAQQHYRRHGRGGRRLGGVHRHWSSAHLSHHDVAWPLQDAAVSNFDLAIGFDWPVWHNAVLTRPLLHVVLQLAYASCCRRSSSRSPTFPKVGLAARNGELVLLAILTLLTTTLISALWPVLGPFATFGAGHERLPARSADACAPAVPGTSTFRPWKALSDAILPHWFWRSCSPTRSAALAWSGWGIAGLNALMLLAIPPVGGHYLADMIVGGAIAVLVVPGTRWLPLLEAKVAHATGISVNALRRRHVAPIAGLPAAPSPADPSSHRYAAASGSAAVAPRRAAPWGS